MDLLNNIEENEPLVDVIFEKPVVLLLSLVRDNELLVDVVIEIVSISSFVWENELLVIVLKLNVFCVFAVESIIKLMRDRIQSICCEMRTNTNNPGPHLSGVYLSANEKIPTKTARHSL